MATINFNSAGTGIGEWVPIIANASRYDAGTNPTGDIVFTGTTAFVFLNPDNSLTVLFGTGFTYGGTTENPVLNGGTVTQIVHTNTFDTGTLLTGSQYATIGTLVATNNSAATLFGLATGGNLQALGAYMTSQPDTININDNDGVDFAGGAGNDTINGGNVTTQPGATGADHLDGQDGNDLIAANGGNDTVYGGEGFDTFNAFNTDGNDVYYGGNSALGGAAQNDYTTGGARLDYRNVTSSGITGTLGPSGGTITQGTSVDTLYYVEQIRGTNQADNITFQVGYVTPTGLNDFEGMNGNDMLTGNGSTRISYAAPVLQGGANGHVHVDLGAGFGQSLGATSLGGASNVGVDTIVTGNLAGGANGVTQVRGSNTAPTGGGFGGDSLVGSNGSWGEGFQGLRGNDTIDGGGGARDEVRYDADAGNGGAAAVNVNLATGTATDGFGNTDTLSNLEMIRGTGGADTLTGGNAANGTSAKDGFEGFRGLAGNDVIDGGAGYDEVRYDSDRFVSPAGQNGVTVNLAAGWAVDGFGSTDSLTDIEGATGTLFTDLFYGDAVDNNFYGLDGNDTFTGGDGFDYFEPGAGDDIIYGSPISAPDQSYDDRDFVSYDDFGATGIGVYIDLNINTFLDPTGGTDTVYDIERVRGTKANDVILGSDTANLREEMFQGLDGNDTIDGRAGYDIADYSADVRYGGTAGVTANLAAGTVIDGFGKTDRLFYVEGVRGTQFNDSFTGDAGRNIYRIIGGSDTVDGGVGTDQVEMYVGDVFGGPGATANLALGTATGVDGQVSTLTSIEDASGSTLDDTLVGSDGNNLLAGWLGDDSLDGGAGNDIISGMSGANTMEGGAGFDVVSFLFDPTVDDYYFKAFGPSVATSWGGVVVDLGAGTATGFDGLTNTLSGFEAVTGTFYADSITGDGGDNSFKGLSGNDTIDGAGGIDTVSYAAANGDGRTFAPIAGINASDPNGVDVDLGTGIVISDGEGGQDTLTSIENVVGSRGDDFFTGSAANNFIDGGEGVDTVRYAHDQAEYTIVDVNGAIQVTHTSGDVDTLRNVEKLVFNGGTPVDVTQPGYTYTGSTGDDEQLGTQAGDNLDGGQGSDSLDGGEGNDTLIGGEGADFMIGVDGNDNLDGGPGDDTAEGGSGAGNDTYTGGSGIDTITYTSTSLGIVVDLWAEMATGGEIDTDRIIGFENVVAGDGNDHVTGDGAANKLEGVAGDDTLLGETNDDTLLGGSGRDSLAGGHHHDVLSGDSDNDILIGGTGNDTIDGGAQELTGGDTAVYSGNRSDYHITEAGGTYTVLDLRLEEGQDSVVDVELFDFNGTLIAVEDLIGEPPTDIALSQSSVAENSPVGTVVGILSATDPTDPDTHTFKIFGTSNEFEIVGNELRVKAGAGLDFETQPTHYLSVVAVDANQTTYWKILQIDLSNANDAPTGMVTIDGTPTEDQVLSAANTLSDQDGMGAVTYQWLRDGNAIGGANGTTYVLGDADVGAAISVRASYTDGLSNPTSVDSAPTSPIGNVNDAPIHIVPGAQTATAGVAKAIGGISVSDVDNASVATMLSAAGLLSASDAGGATVGGSGTSMLTISGTQTQVNAALATLSYVKATGGGDVITVTTSDLSGGINSDTIAVNVGSAGSGNTIVGTAGADIIRFSQTVAGQPKVTAFADTVLADGGSDIVDAGAGDDTVDGGAGSDTLYGSSGSDTLQGGADNDRLDGGTEGDLLQGGSGIDTLRGGGGNDSLYGGEDNDNLDGGLDNDSLFGEAGSDTLNGRDGNDVIDGGTGSDTLNGNSGSDTLQGGADNDRLDGGTEGDLLQGDSGIDTLRGGDGNDSLYGGEDNDNLDGGLDNDSLYGEGGSDTLNGRDGNDTLSGGAAADTLTGGLGQDHFVFDASSLGSGVDRITDFVALDDTIVLSSSAFGAAQADGFGVLLASNFVVGAAALTADHHIIYNKVTGALLYDQDGSDTGFAAVQFATLATKPTISSADFLLL